MGHRVVGGRLPPIYGHLTIGWHSRPYASKTACWGCGLEPDKRVIQRAPTAMFMTNTETPRIPLCQWCADLTVLMLASHDRRFNQRRQQ